VKLFLLNTLLFLNFIDQIQIYFTNIKKKVSQARGKDSQKSSRVFTKPMGTSSGGSMILGPLGGVNLLNETSRGTKILLLGLPDSGIVVVVVVFMNMNFKIFNSIEEGEE
jgi:hypothetical protein